ncbi:hypothetical protein [Nostoc sp. DedQUE07]|uniref:hypothetical protein n=1 Tax=Nostoc sp. DedQUE07 TaxID=3075392 RepID=UPI002AD21DF9|nr:hypothetical protein [Nostoc sp. DedQUE07]MDZ8131976.1 hypothetical protein [Nostoc sp. DedQUE07]
MINPSTINPLALLSVPLEMRSQLPITPYIYFAIDSEGVVQYIGRSKVGKCNLLLIAYPSKRNCVKVRKS